MAGGTLTKSLMVTSPVIAAALISLFFSVNLAINPDTEAGFIPPTTTVPTTTTPPTAPPTTTPVPTIPDLGGEF